MKLTETDRLAQAIDEFREAFQAEIAEIIRFIRADNETDRDK